MRISLPIAILALAVAGCSGGEDTAPAPAETASPAPTPTATVQPMTAELPGPDDKDPQDLLTYWRQAVEAGDVAASRRAWRDMIGKGGSAPRWANLSGLTVTFGEGQQEGAAGSIYDSLPVTLTGTDSGGKQQTLKGKMTLRRVNDVPGATPEQLSWRIVSIDWEG